MTTPDRLEVGRIGRAHGLHGEVAFTLTSDVTARVAKGSVLHIGDRPLTVVASRPHQGRWLVRFAEVTDRTAAEALRGEILTAEPIEGDGEVLWVHELVGARVVDASGVDVGPILAVEANPASDLLVIEIGGREVLVPSVFVTERRDGVIVIDPPEGLLDLGAG
ncbi:MAG: ribosome maturation factor RimM [Actinomycetes bacterium]